MIKSNHWVATSYLQRLKDESETEKSVKQLIEDIRESSQNAQYELENRVTE